jgi:hypothetical protein
VIGGVRNPDSQFVTEDPVNSQTKQRTPTTPTSSLYYNSHSSNCKVQEEVDEPNATLFRHSLKRDTPIIAAAKQPCRDFWSCPRELLHR